VLLSVEPYPQVVGVGAAVVAESVCLKKNFALDKKSFLIIFLK
jgi:hypothetical protein